MIFTCVKAKRLPRFREVVGLVLAFVSTFIIATHGNPTALSMPILGLMWGLATGIAVAFYGLYPRKLLKQWGSFAVTGGGMLFGGIFSVIVAQPWTISITLDSAAIITLVVVTLVGSFGAFALYLQGVADIGPLKASLLSAAEPVSAAFFSWAWLHTQFPPIDCVGFALMIIMVFFVTADRPEKNLDIIEVPLKNGERRKREENLVEDTRLAEPVMGESGKSCLSKTGGSHLGNESTEIVPNIDSVKPERPS